MEKIVVITGGTSGLGKELVDLYSQNGDRVFILARTVDESKDNQFKCDVSIEDNVKNCIEKIIKLVGHIDVLINNAGFGISGITELITTEEARSAFDVNFWGAWYMTKYALPYMPKKSKIINMCSAMSFFPLPYRSFYASSKSALSSYSYCLRMELKNLKIDVTTICPGDIKTNFTKNRKKSFITNERYGNAIEKATKKVDSREDKRMSAIECSKKIYHICQKKKLKPMYIIGGKYKLLYFVSRIVPMSWLLCGINKFTT